MIGHGEKANDELNNQEIIKSKKALAQSTTRASMVN